MERRGRRIGVLAYSAVDDGAWKPRGLRYAMLLPSSLGEIRAARTQVDVLVVSVHWGRRDGPSPFERSVSGLGVSSAPAPTWSSVTTLTSCSPSRRSVARWCSMGWAT